MSETFPYEQLDGTRFQRLVQALLVPEFPGLQCFPLTGADGGRDAVHMQLENGRQQDSLVFQVKFREYSPLGAPTSKTLYAWLTKQLSQEIPSLIALKQRGAKSYIVATNIKGTGNLDSGLRDKVVTWANEHLPLPTVFWWRDDIDTRISGRYDLIFHFNLFNGPESVRAALEFYLGSRDAAIADPSLRTSPLEPRILAITHYLAEQYRLETRLQFEQVDIESPLLDLFVDVPILYPGETKDEEDLHSWVQSAHAERSDTPWEADASYKTGARNASYSLRFASPCSADRSLRSSAGAAQLLLSETIPRSCRRIVIQAAPGQGKSTLGQYVSQVHRIRLLKIKEDIEKLPDNHKNSPVRLPIRLEFRYIATWFSGRNPWTSEQVSKTNDREYWAPSIESYIAAHIRYAIGGATFKPEDVISVLTQTPTFMCLDGLDEVADIELRKKIVTSTEAMLSRLDRLGADIQVLVTSRPSIFLESPTFSQESFLILQLAPLNGRLVEAYTESWMSVRALSDEQRTEIREVLDANLHQSHVTELSRNPMQLAILLWLISMRGRSLPQQRTALYESYMEKFLDRESKSEVVRTHRKLLLSLHGYLGWILHSRAELGQEGHETGDIAEEELKSLFHAYLKHEEYPVGLVDQLFVGAERFFLLVSRIEGRYEFEVQPIREFFAARYLYKTAPRSTSSERMSGARPDRLDELIRNSFWLNVARFFCGYYDKGELADMARRLTDLCNEPNYRQLGYPRFLIALILQDGSISESRRDTRELITAMADDLGVTLTSSNVSLVDGSTPLLPADSGGTDTFVACLYRAFDKAKTREQIVKLGSLIRINESDDSRVQHWLEREPRDKSERDQWLVHGIYLNTISLCPTQDAMRIFDPNECTDLDWIRCVEAGRLDIGFHDRLRFDRVRKVLGDGHKPVVAPGVTGPTRRLRNLLDSADVIRFAPSFEKGPLASANIGGAIKDIERWDKNVESSLIDCFRKISCITTDGTRKDLFRSLDQSTQILKEEFGDSWISWKLALLAGAIPGIQAKRRDLYFGNTAISPALIARKARLSAGDKDFWKAACEAADSHALRMAISASLLAWADPEVLADILPHVATWWEEISAWHIVDLRDLAGRLTQLSGVGRNPPRMITEDALKKFTKTPISLYMLLTSRMEFSARPIFRRWLRREFVKNRKLVSASHGTVVAGHLLSDAINIKPRGSNWAAHLEYVRMLYQQTTGIGFREAMARAGFRLLPFKSQLRISMAILSSPMDYPIIFVEIANVIVESEIMGEVKPMAASALEQNWFPGLPR